MSHDYNWYDPNLSSPCPSYPCDYGVGVAGHGTGTMGVIVGHEGDGRIYGNVDYNGQFINYTGAITTGVAPGAVWIATKVGGLNVADWLIAPCPIGVHPNPTSPDPRCDPDKRPHIVNFSFTGGSDVANRLRSAGILPAFSAGTALLLDALWSSDQADPTTYGETDISKLECLLTSTAIDMVDSGGNPRGGWPGPDYASGYGRIDVYEAARAVADSNFPLWLKLLGAAPGNPASMSGTVLPGQTSIVEIEISAVCPTTGAYQAQLVVNSNDPEQNPTILTVNLTVQNEPLPTCPYEPPTGW